MHKFLNFNQDDNTAIIMMYGDIKHDGPVSSADFVSQLNYLAENYPKIQVHINSNGGEVFEGIAIRNAIINSKADITMYVDGVAASIAAIIALCGKPLYMSKYSKLMIHPVSGGCSGNVEQMKSMLTTMEDLQDNLAEMISKKCGLKKSEVKEKYFDGPDHWISAVEAKKCNLADGVFDIEAPADKLTTNENIYTYFLNRLEDESKNKNDMTFIESLQRINGFENKSESEILMGVNSLVNQAEKVKDLDEQNKALKDEIASLKAQANEEFVNRAVTDGKIAETQKDQFLKLMATDPETTKSIIDSMTTKKAATPSVNDFIHEGAKSSFENKSWNELDKEGRLAELKAQNIELFKAKYKAQFGVDYLE